MASLTGQLVAETYKALLKTIDNDILTASEKQITDGFGGGSNVFIDSQGFLRANKYKVTNGLATQFLKADGSLDSNTYLTGITSSQIITALGYTPVTNARTLTINGTTYDLSANRSWTIAGTAAVWGNISGTLSDQTDLQNALNAKFNNPTGTISQYIRGDGSLATFPAITGFVPYTGATANVDLGEFALSAEYLAIDTDTTHSTDVGEIVWNPIDGTFDMGLLNGVVLQAGQELHFYGKASGAIGNGKAVMFAGVEGDHLLMSLADPATINANPQYFIGVATQDFANNDFGYVTILGKVRNLDTTAFTLGSVLYFDSANATDGLLTETQPIAPNAKIEVAAVVRVHATQGTLMVRPHIMPKMSMIQDVYIADPANNHGLFYDLANGYWENKSIASALGYTPQSQLDGTGFVKASGTTITYDNSTYLTTTDAASTYQRLDKMVSNLLASATEYPNSNAVINALALKADALNPVFTGYMTISGAEPKLYFTDTDQNPDYFIGADAGFFRIYDQTAGTTRFVINSSGVTTIAGDLIVGTIAKSGGTATQFLKADGSIDSSTYVTSASLANYLLITTAASTYQRLDKMVSNLLASDTEYPNSNAVLAKLALKADAANPVFTGDMTISGIAPKLYFTDTDNNPDYTLFVDSGYFYIYDQTAGATKFQITPLGNAINTGTLTSASFIKSGGTSSQYLMADGSVSTGLANAISGSLTSGYITKATGTNTIANSLMYDNGSQIAISGNLELTKGANRSIIIGSAPNYDWRIRTSDNDLEIRMADVLTALKFYYPDGSAIFASTIRTTGLAIGVAPTANVLVVRGENSGYDGSITIGARSSIQHFDSGQTTLSICNDYNSSASRMEFRMRGNTAANSVFTILGNGVIGFNTTSPSRSYVFSNPSNKGAGSFEIDPFDTYVRFLSYNRSTNTYLPLSLSEGGSNVLIGLTTDSGYKLDVNGTGRFIGNLQIGDYTSSPTLTLAAANNGINKINFYDQNSTEGLYLRTDGETYGGTMTFGARWDADEAKIVFKMYQSSAGAGYNARVGIGTTDPAGELTAKRPYNSGFTPAYIGNSSYTAWNRQTYDTFVLQQDDVTSFRMVEKNGETTGSDQVLSFSIGDGVSSIATSAQPLSFYVNGSPTGLAYQGLSGTHVLRLNTNGSANFFGSLNVDSNITTGGSITSTVSGTSELRLRGGGYGANYNTSLRSVSGAAGILQFGNNADNYILIGNTATGGYLDIRANVSAESIVSGNLVMRLTSGGNVLIGTQSDAGYKLYVNGTGYFNSGLVSNSDVSMSGNLTLNTGANRFIQIGSATNYYWRLRALNDDLEIRMADSFAALKMYYPNGSATFINSVTATAFYESSDMRLKTLIDESAQIAGIENLEAKLYEKNGKIELGYFAQDAEKLMPYAVTKNSDGFLNLSYREVHTAKIARLEKRVAELEKQLNLN